LESLGRGQPEKVESVALVALCDGIGGAMRALEFLKVHVGLYFSSEVCDRCRRVVLHRWPNTLDIGPVEDLDYEMLQDKIYRTAWLKHMVVIAGPPCQDLSGLNPSGKGLAGKSSGLFYEVAAAIERLRALALKRGLSFDFVVENVASMESNPAKPRDEMSRVLGCEPCCPGSGRVHLVQEAEALLVQF
jgi:site-specific DNA-cytosine methylase